jgi:hypothetical protein
MGSFQIPLLPRWQLSTKCRMRHISERYVLLNTHFEHPRTKRTRRQFFRNSLAPAASCQQGSAKNKHYPSIPFSF